MSGYFTVVYKDISPGTEPATLHDHPKATAMAWGHVMNEVNAWRERFPNYRYRPQDDCVELVQSAPELPQEPQISQRIASED